jgi:hypothetical protein
MMSLVGKNIMLAYSLVTSMGISGLVDGQEIPCLLGLVGGEDTSS